MNVLVVDCCSLVHAKAMRELEHAPLVLLAWMAEHRAVALWTTKRVRGELGESSLSLTCEGWEAQGWLQLANVKLQEVREIKNALRRGDKEPGDHDKALIALARRLKAPLLTHDAGAAQLALRVKVQVWDLADLAGWCVEEGYATLEEVSAAWGGLEGLPWPWPDYPWSGSLARTLADRSGA